MHICPLCQQEFETPIKLGNHLKNGDVHHQFLKELIKLDKKKNIDIDSVYEEHKDIVINCVDVQASVEAYKNILKIKREEAKRRKEEEKIQEKKEEQEEKIRKVEAKKLEKLQKKKEEAEQYRQMLLDRQFKKQYEKRFVKELETEYKPMNLVKYFYDLVNIREYNGIMASATIKSLYFTYNLEPEQVKRLLRYMAETGHSKISDAKFVIEEAERFYQYAKEVKTEKTIPHLVKIFYNLKNAKIDKKMFVKNVDRLKVLIKDNNLTYEEAEEIVTYMAKANATSLFWFGDYIASVVGQNKIQRQVTKEEIEKDVKDVMNGNKKYTDLTVKTSFYCYKKIKENIMTGKFDSDYNYSEFLYKIQMIPDKELIDFISNHNDRKSRFETLYKINHDEETLAKINNEYQMYKKWTDAYMN